MDHDRVQMAGILMEERQMVAAHREEVAELAAALRKVTKNLRLLMESELEGTDKEAFREDLENYGVLEAEALLKRIDEGGG
jgi:hypothetical protein